MGIGIVFLGDGCLWLCNGGGSVLALAGSIQIICCVLARAGSIQMGHGAEELKAQYRVKV